MTSIDAVIAVDFDGCLCESKWPEIGEPNESVIRALIQRQREGAKLILWTCRSGKLLDEAIEWSRTQGIEFDKVNENLQERIDEYGNDSRKISADEYWDDRAVYVEYGR